MAITTYAELKTTVADWLARSDLTSYIDDYIDLAESEFNRDIRHRRMVTSTTLTTVADTATVAVPSDFREARALILQSSPNVILEYRTTQTLEDRYKDGANGKPASYTMIGDTFKFGPTPDAVYSVTLEYYAAIPALSDSQTTNWLLTNFPDVYLSGVLMKASAFIHDDERVAMWENFQAKALASLERDGERSEIAGAMASEPDIQVV